MIRIYSSGRLLAEGKTNRLTGKVQVNTPLNFAAPSGLLMDSLYDHVPNSFRHPILPRKVLRIDDEDIAQALDDCRAELGITVVGNQTTRLLPARLSIGYPDGDLFNWNLDNHYHKSVVSLEQHLRGLMEQEYGSTQFDLKSSSIWKRFCPGFPKFVRDCFEVRPMVSKAFFLERNKPVEMLLVFDWFVEVPEVEPINFEKLKESFDAL